MEEEVVTFSVLVFRFITILVPVAAAVIQHNYKLGMILVTLPPAHVGFTLQAG